MIIHNFAEGPSLVSQYLAEMRSTSVQTDRLRFRRNLERLGEIFAYEISKTLGYRKEPVTTPLGVTANCNLIIEYLASPILDGKTLVLCDPMLATGASMELSYRALLTKGAPAKVHVASVIASQKAVDYMASVMPEASELWVGVIDPEINAHSYIVPGLGDAGDLAYGTKE